MPDAQSPATPEQIKSFLDTVLPIVEKEHRHMMDMDPVGGFLAKLNQQTRAEQDEYNRAQFFERLRTARHYGDEWSRQFVQWFVYTLRSFVAEPIERRRTGLGYALPAGLSDQFEALGPEAEQQIFATFSRPVLQVARLSGYTNVILLRQVSP